MTEEASEGGLARALTWLHRLEDALLALFLTAMIVLAPLQIFLRIFFDRGLTWADPLIRVLVLWVGMLGAVAASRGDRHITIDALSRLLSGRARAAVGVAVHAFTAAVSALVAYHSWRFVETEREFESMAFLGIPAWTLQIILPVAFGLIAVRYALITVGDAGVLLGLREPEPDDEAGEASL